jgi:hypothetical protein
MESLFEMNYTGMPFGLFFFFLILADFTSSGLGKDSIQGSP